MRAIVLLTILGLAGCAASMEQLEAEANATGDWSRVDARLEADARRAERARREAFPNCPAGMIAVRRANGGHGCSTVSDVRGMIEGRRIGR